MSSWDPPGAGSPSRDQAVDRLDSPAVPGSDQSRYPVYDQAPPPPPASVGHPFGSAPPALSADAVRHLDVEVSRIRTVVLQTLRQLGCTITVDQFTAVEATRGSTLGGLTLTARRVPVRVRVQFEHAGDSTTVQVAVSARGKLNTAQSRTSAAAYTDAFAELLAGIDEALRRLSPAVELTPWNSGLGGAVLPTAGNAFIARAEHAISRKSDRLLEGPQDPRARSVMQGAGLDMLHLQAGDKVAQLSGDQVDGVLTAGQLISQNPGGLPPKLAGEVRALVSDLEGRLAGPASHRSGHMQLADAQIPVLSFLRQQSQLRDQLPMRLVMTCTTCRLEKVVNPDFARMRERSRRGKILSSSFGAVFTSKSISPYVLLGRLTQLKKSDPDFVCQRCQGLDADETMITFCPQCGDRRAETVLRSCPKCQFDFRTLIPRTSIWRELNAPPPQIVQQSHALPAAYPQGPGPAMQPPAEPAVAPQTGDAWTSTTIYHRPDEPNQT